VAVIGRLSDPSAMLSVSPVCAVAQLTPFLALYCVTVPAIVTSTRQTKAPGASQVPALTQYVRFTALLAVV
jgi:hypothetical protein